MAHARWRCRQGRNRGLNRDHIGLCTIDQVTVPDAFPKANFEIAEVGFFAVSSLPDGTTPATRRRLAEMCDQQPADSYW
jgi:hypothetical protein